MKACEIINMSDKVPADLKGMTTEEVAGMVFNGVALTKFWDLFSEWSQATFGTDAERGPVGPLKHLAKEAQEAIAKPDDLEEYADCLLLVFDAARRAGFTLEKLVDAAFEKLEKNKARQWPKPTSDEPVEHVKDELADPNSCTNDRDAKVAALIEAVLDGDDVGQGYAGVSAKLDKLRDLARAIKNAE